MNAVVKGLFKMFGHTLRVHVSKLAAAMVDQCQNDLNWLLRQKLTLALS